MRLTVLQKYIIAFLGLTLIILIASLGLARWSFDRGFLNYVNALEQQRLESSQALIAQEYTRLGGNWSGLTQRRLAELLRTSLPGARGAGSAPGADLPPHLRDRPGRPPPPDRRGRPPGGQPPYPPTAVYDTQNRFVAGADLADSEGELNRAAIVVDGITVGELRSATRHTLVSPVETAFSSQQLQASWLIGVVAMILALCISVLLARTMLSPVRRMHEDVGRLSRGDYTTRIDSSRKDELGDLMRNLDRLAATLDESRRSRQRWFADVSHELRTPVTVLVGELEAMQDGVRKFDEKQVESLMQEVLRLRYLIDDLYELSVSDIGGLRYEYRKLDLAVHLQSTLDTIRTRASERGIELALSSEPVSVEADENRLDQLLQNLLGNSLDYTDAPGKIEVKLSRAADLAVIRIEDSSPGVCLEDCEKLFEPLYRVESSRSRRTGGTGLGLAICRKIVEAHGGQISAAPSSLGGLCIQIELPVA